MKIDLMILYIILSFLKLTNNIYIVIPFNKLVFNNSDLEKDFLSKKFSEDIYTDLLVANPIQKIKLLLRLDQNDLIIKEPEYNSSLSNSFLQHKYISNKLICNDSFHLLTINSSEELNKFFHKNKNDKKIIKQNNYKEYRDINFVYLNKSLSYNFLEKELLSDEIEKIKKNTFGILGLRFSYMNTDSSPILIKLFKMKNIVNSSIFTFFFNKNEENYGYLIIGEKVIDKEKEFEETNNTNFAMRNGKLSWDLRADRIYSQANINYNNKNFFLDSNKEVELKIDKSYILGSQNYKIFIEEIFFDFLIKENICYYKKLIIEQSYGTYVCDSKSNLFLDYYNNRFPNLVFKLYNIVDELILTKKNLFVYNNYNKSDTNIYFNIYFSTIYTTKWMLGRPFLEKYRFSFDSDKSFILYHKNKFNDNEIKSNKENNKSYKNIKILFIIFLILVIFFLGYLFHKSITKIPRKQKANELNDEFEYSISNNKNSKLYNDLDVNNSNFKENNYYLELGQKNI